MVRKDRKQPIHPSLQGQGYVLYSRGRWVQYWDNMFLLLLLYYCFSIPVSCKTALLIFLRKRKAI